MAGGEENTLPAGYRADDGLAVGAERAGAGELLDQLGAFQVG